MTPVYEVSASVEVQAFVNGKRVDLEDLAVNCQRLLNAAVPMLPVMWLDDTAEQKALRQAVSFIRDMGVFE